LGDFAKHFANEAAEDFTYRDRSDSPTLFFQSEQGCPAKERSQLGRSIAASKDVGDRGQLLVDSGSVGGSASV